MRESIYLSYNKTGDWQKGLGATIDWSTGSVQIASRYLYILEKTIKNTDYDLSSTDQVIVSTSGMIYVLRENGDLYGIDWRLGQMDLLDKAILASDERSENLRYLAANNRIYCLESGDKKLQVSIYSLLNRCWIRNYDIHLDRSWHAVSMDKGLICVWDKANNFYWYDIDKGLLKGQTYISAYRPDGQGIKRMSVKGLCVSIDDGRDTLTEVEIGYNGHTRIRKKAFDEQIKSFEASGKKTYLDDHGRMYVIDGHKGIDVYHYSRIYGDQVAKTLSRGIYYFPVLDSGVEGNQWHRLMLKGDFPNKAHINLKYYAYDRQQVDTEDFERIESIFQSLDYTRIDDSDDFLFQQAYGRYMIIRMELIGSREMTPTIEKARVYINRESYSQYLPEIYQTGDHKDFIERFLSIFESINLEVEEQIDLMARNFNPKTASREFLQWMLGWMDFNVSEHWATDQLRDLIQLMPKLQRRRGTVWAIKTLLELFLRADIMIIENSRILGESFDHSQELSKILKQHYGSSPYGFTVLSSRESRLSEGELEDVKAILNQETPPYCQYQFIELEHGLFLDKHSYLGLNTVLTDYSSFRLDNETLLPFNTLLQEE